MRVPEQKITTLEVLIDRESIKDTPTSYSNYAELAGGQDELYFLFCIRDDHNTTFDGSVARVKATPVQRVILSTQHARQFAIALNKQIEVLDQISRQGKVAK